MIWTILLAITGLCAGWLTPIEKQESSRNGFRVKWHGWIFLIMIITFTFLSATNTKNAEHKADEIREKTLDVVLRDIDLNSWRAQRIVEIERLNDITKTRTKVGEELNSLPIKKDSMANAYYNQMNSFEDQYKWAAESVDELINQWRSFGFDESSLKPLLNIYVDLNLQRDVWQKVISQGTSDEALRKWVLDTYLQRVRDLAESLRVRAAVSLEYEYSRRLTIDLENNKKILK